MAVAARHHPNARRLAGPEVRAKILAVIGKRVTPADADDIAQSAYVRLMMLPSLPEAYDDLRALVVTVVRGLIVDHHRKRKVRKDRRQDGQGVDEACARRARRTRPAGSRSRRERKTIANERPESATTVRSVSARGSSRRQRSWRPRGRTCPECARGVSASNAPRQPSRAAGGAT